ncbi:2-octaprenylphenol hydroxylase [Vibrio ruber DSM 16370]|uniref:2-octaprenylphenol hydroxylase n=1 Tax=Vibrio ruber (strain DSM 16370 / JCM 11486 / BCRC 17186 / CECT 7878 / LMG 23124 / VR1) TaxID=1123498 RepID=A0A1R4L943_VIBR1|nr:FAD-dependent 2-octaprenylphenol hydroxylase [Vibrio ruber]SJN53062.1 2-octaprenylphenol hydroxylase [Vibrio ruber DSM 16370]
MMQSFDIAIIGGGMVGLTLAAALQNTDLRIAVIEGYQPVSTLEDVPDIRVSALSRASEHILKNVGIWDGIVRRRASPYGEMHVWEKDSFARIEFDCQQLSQPDLGHIVENRVVQLAALDVVQSQQNVTFFMPAHCQSMVVGESEVWLTLDNGSALTAKLIVGADGANSWVRQQQDIPLTHWDYGHTALVATVMTEEPHRQIARQIFTPQGPLAFLPLADPHMCSIVWSTEPQRAETLLNMPTEQFNRSLCAEFDRHLGLCQLVSERAIFPLKMRYARDFVCERIALAGDAAHTIHPLAGQGVNLGLLDAASLAQELKTLWQQGKDIGYQRNLRQYERWRKAEAAKMITAMQGFKTLFSGDFPVKKLVRGLGMSVLNQVPNVKNEMMMQALGVRGNLPELAKTQSID